MRNDGPIGVPWRMLTRSVARCSAVIRNPMARIAAQEAFNPIPPSTGGDPASLPASAAEGPFEEAMRGRMYLGCPC